MSYHSATKGSGKERVVGKLIEAIVCILKNMARVLAKLVADGDEVHRDQQSRQGQEPEGALPADGLQRGHVILGDKLLLVDHLRGHDDLSADDEDVTEQEVGGRVVVAVGPAQEGHVGAAPGLEPWIVHPQVLWREEGIVGSLVVIRIVAALDEQQVAEADDGQARDHEKDANPSVGLELSSQDDL